MLSGRTGSWIVAASGALLCTNLALGLALALRGRNKIWKDLFARPSGPPSVRRYKLHKAAGLWVVIPALVVGATGVTLAVCNGLPAGDEPTLSTVDQGGRSVPTTTRRAIEVALAQNPGSSLSAVILPVTPQGWFQILLHEPHEMPRFWGTTRVYVSAESGQVLGPSGIAQPGVRQVSEAVYPLHCGQIAGLIGRIIALGVGLALLTAIVFGFALWRSRRSARAASRATERLRVHGGDARKALS
jgi:uncharacterized iron-regulated membrane protein